MKLSRLLQSMFSITLTLALSSLALAAHGDSDSESKPKSFPTLPMSEYIFMAKVKTHPSYLQLAQIARSQGASFTCKNIEEVLTSKNYSSSNSGTSIYSMVVVSCFVSSQDGLGPVRKIGLVTMSGSDIVQFTAVEVHQAD